MFAMKRLQGSPLPTAVHHDHLALVMRPEAHLLPQERHMSSQPRQSRRRAPRGAPPRPNASACPPTTLRHGPSHGCSCSSPGRAVCPPSTAHCSVAHLPRQSNPHRASCPPRRCPCTPGHPAISCGPGRGSGCGPTRRRTRARRSTCIPRSRGCRSQETAPCRRNHLPRRTCPGRSSCCARSGPQTSSRQPIVRLRSPAACHRPTAPHSWSHPGE
mmetsp:Transcript_97483/g.271180  ORF Transcript_97483/g.271180 Transcript_97483/m.271180 type:complete len:215 (+) Transcript_97483:171-815(+)